MTSIFAGRRSRSYASCVMPILLLKGRSQCLSRSMALQDMHRVPLTGSTDTATSQRESRVVRPVVHILKRRYTQRSLIGRERPQLLLLLELMLLLRIGRAVRVLSIFHRFHMRAVLVGLVASGLVVLEMRRTVSDV